MNTETGVKAEVHVATKAKVDPRHDLFQAKDPFSLVIFGASGDLGKRKLIPALYHLDATGYLPDRYAVGVSLELK